MIIFLDISYINYGIHIKKHSVTYINICEWLCLCKSQDKPKAH